MNQLLPTHLRSHHHGPRVTLGSAATSPNNTFDASILSTLTIPPLLEPSILIQVRTHDNKRLKIK